MPEQSKMEISLFSGMTILWNGTPILEHSARLNKPLELLALLLLRGDKKLTNEQLMDGLWESDEIENPAGALKNAAYSLRKFLQKADCCFSKRMRKFFRKNEKSMLQFCNKNSKRKGRLQWVKKPL